MNASCTVNISLACDKPVNVLEEKQTCLFSGSWQSAADPLQPAQDDLLALLNRMHCKRMALHGGVWLTSGVCVKHQASNRGPSVPASWTVCPPQPSRKLACTFLNVLCCRLPFVKAPLDVLYAIISLVAKMINTASVVLCWAFYCQYPPHDKSWFWLTLMVTCYLTCRLSYLVFWVNILAKKPVPTLTFVKKWM